MRANPTSRFKGTDIFSRRIVITVSRSGLLAILLAIGITAVAAGARYYTGLLVIISVITSMVSLVTTIEARRQLRNFRFEMQEKLVAQLEEWTVPEDMPDLRESVEAAFQDVEDPDAKSRFIRLSKRPYTR